MRIYRSELPTKYQGNKNVLVYRLFEGAPTQINLMTPELAQEVRQNLRETGAEEVLYIVDTNQTLYDDLVHLKREEEPHGGPLDSEFIHLVTKERGIVLKIFPDLGPRDPATDRPN